MVKLHWKSVFSSAWNRQALFVLASAFTEEQPNCDMTLNELQLLIRRKLERTRKEWIRRNSMQANEIDMLRADEAKKCRRKGRLMGVSQYIYPSSVADKHTRLTTVAAVSSTNIMITTQHSGIRSSGYTGSLGLME
jgi:hypothetical protein